MQRADLLDEQGITACNSDGIMVVRATDVASVLTERDEDMGDADD